MKIVTWNINGLRTFTGVLRETLHSFNADVICLQETKTTRATLEADLACIAGYNAYFAFPRLQSGYSGVATFTSDDARPFAVNELLQRCPDGGIEELDSLATVTRPSVDSEKNESLFLEPKELANIDSEGRCISTLYKFTEKGGRMRSLVVFNLYCPRKDPERPERALFKYKFNAMLEQQARHLVTNGCHVILAGDMNISHKRIDNCDPDEDFESAPERIWMDRILDDSNSIHFVDAFRYFHPSETNQYTCWNSQKSARVTNFGTRIDYILCDAGLVKYLRSCDIHPDVMGSDHCPVSAVLDIEVVSAEKVLKKCTRFWPEFAGTQTSLKGFLTKARPQVPVAITTKKRPLETQPKLNAFFAKKRNSSEAVNGDQHDLASSNDKRSRITSEKNDLHNATIQTTKTVGIVPTQKAQLSASWKNILKGPPPAPLCTGHGETAVLRIVKKDGPNKGRKFFCCCRPEGAIDNKEARCQFFVWI